MMPPTERPDGDGQPPAAAPKPGPALKKPTSATDGEAMAERRRGVALAAQLSVIAPLLGVWSVAAVGLAAVATRSDAHQADLLVNPVTRSGLPWYAGFVTFCGILAWTVAAVAAFAGAWVAGLADRPAAGRFLTHGGLLTVVLVLDDLFQFHSGLLPDDLGVPKVLVLGAYGLAGGAWLLGHRAEIARTRTAVLALALGALGTAVLVDQLGPGTARALLIEEGIQLLGVLGWATYFALTAADVTRSVVRARPTTVDPDGPVVGAGRPGA